MSIPGVTLHHILYVSLLAADRQFDVVGAISQSARRRNAEWGVRSVLLFDGHRFAQRIIGPSESATRLMQRILGDLRHTGVLILCDEPMVAGDAERGAFMVGYCDAELLDILDRRCDPPMGASALSLFQAILLGADLSD